MIIHMLPGSGKTWLCEIKPHQFVDTDSIFQEAGLDFVGAVETIDREFKLALIDAAREGRVVLTNDPTIADLSCLHVDLSSYLADAARRGDISEDDATRWYSDCESLTIPTRRFYSPQLCVEMYGDGCFPDLYPEGAR